MKELLLILFLIVFVVARIVVQLKYGYRVSVLVDLLTLLGFWFFFTLLGKLGL